VIARKSILKRVIKSAFAELGIEVHRTGTPSDTGPDYGLDDFFPLLRGLGLHPTHIVDVGANHGSWTRAATRYFPAATYTLVEPQAHLKQHVETPFFDQNLCLENPRAGQYHRPQSQPQAWSSVAVRAGIPPQG
jgi:hypothetical protein